MTTPFRLDTPFYQIPGSQPEATFGAIMEILLKTRLKMNLETNQGLYDEDVNAYLAGLLVSYIDPTYLQAVAPVVSAYDLDIYQAVEKAEDRYHVYWIYKVNADDLLVTLGLFRPLWHEAKGEVIRAKCYYSYASDYQRRIYGRLTAVGEIQTKLADRAERYLAILAEARGDYLHLMNHLNPEQVETLQQHLRDYEKELPLKVKRDEFLDAYSAWQSGYRDQNQRQRLLKVVQELKDLDSTFDAETVLHQLSDR